MCRGALWPLANGLVGEMKNRAMDGDEHLFYQFWREERLLFGRVLDAQISQLIDLQVIRMRL